MNGLRLFGFLLAGGLSLILAAGCSRRPPQKKKKKKTPKVEKEVDEKERLGIDASQTGAVMFICNNQSHGDQESLIRYCPSCRKRDWFYQHPEKNAFFCYKCDDKLQESKIVCPDCGDSPKNPVRIKRY